MSVSASLAALLLALPVATAAEKPKIQMETYGWARLDASYDSADVIDQTFPLWVKPQAGDETDAGSQLYTHARWTRYGWRMLPYEVAEGIKVSTVVELDFINGGSESRALPRMRLAFGKIDFGQFTLIAGQHWDIASPLIASGSKTPSSGTPATWATAGGNSAAAIPPPSAHISSIWRSR